MFDTGAGFENLIEIIWNFIPIGILLLIIGVIIFLIVFGITQTTRYLKYGLKPWEFPEETERDLSRHTIKIHCVNCGKVIGYSRIPTHSRKSLELLCLNCHN